MRPEIRTAQVRKQGQATACRDFLLALEASDRPAEATDTDVRTSTMETIEEATSTAGSVAAVDDVECPCVRLGANSCRREVEA